jgi:hypothetical protein
MPAKTSFPSQAHCGGAAIMAAAAGGDVEDEKDEAAATEGWSGRSGMA